MAFDQRNSAKKVMRPNLRLVPSQPQDLDPESALLEPVAHALANDSLPDLLEWASSLLLTLSAPKKGEADPHEILDALIASDRVETSALLAMIEALAEDRLIRQRASRALGRRSHQLPPWLENLESASVNGVARIDDVFGDTVQFFIELNIPRGEPLLVGARIDCVEGYIVKDVFFIQSTIEVGHSIHAQYTDHLVFSTPTQSDVRACLNDALTYERFLERRGQPFSYSFVDEVPGQMPAWSGNWPLARPILKWAISFLDIGGCSDPHPDLSEQGVARLAAQFLASEAAEGLSSNAKEIFESMCMCSRLRREDPFRWSPSKLVTLFGMTDERREQISPCLQSEVPAYLEALIFFGAELRGLDKRFRDETLRVLDEFCQRDDQPTMRHDAPEEPLWDNPYCDHLARLLGGNHVFNTLTVTELPDEPFDTTGIPDDLHPLMATLSELIEEAAVPLFDREFTTAAKRILAACARHNTAQFQSMRCQPNAMAIAAILVAFEFNHGYRATRKAVCERLGRKTVPHERVRDLEATAFDLSLVTPTDVMTSFTKHRIVAIRDLCIVRPLTH